MSRTRQYLFTKFQPLLRVALIGALAFSLILDSGAALAARSGGRMGGSSFRSRPAPTRPYSSPNRGYGGGPVYPGGGFGFPFLIPFFGFGGGFGGLFSILVFIAIANFLVKSFRGAGRNEDGELGGYSDQGYDNPTVSLNSLNIGLLAEARDLQPELDQIARTANTGSPEGLSLMLQETSLALTRHPEYWAYASAETQQTRLQSAEAQFNRLTLAERSKLTAETLSNVNRQLKEAQTLTADTSTQALVTQDAPGEYIVVTLIVASQGKLALPKVNSPQDLRQALNQLGSVSSDRLLALEVLWQPQAAGDTLTSEDLVGAYPNLKLL
ncbi:MAG: DUF1517 domain-containing protein [Aphanocapsa sp. GSE-SYN-MK-11-07L]|jgi:uncharacterized membrane protein|nr:DUF1517 domain-containing protein [Aphanocapsa sp. GSE-SYN-MK-11-07L]